ncbi:MAG: hypothetical protein K1060chlam5_01177 [Candidatus Anoxychlamydiales bacterium]|nr:hypothetical protein [Candidatus Anoxychlamydiales bacterium]
MSFTLISKKILFFFVILLIALLPKSNAVENNINGLPNISTSIQDPSSNWIVSADLLAWLVSEEVSSIWADVITVGDNTSSWEAKVFKFKWDYGFRISTGYHVHDKWDTALYWTRFHTDAKRTIPYKPNATIIPEFFAAFLSGDSPQSMSVKWSLLLNMFDWEIGQSYWVSKELFLRPFLGVKGGWINQSIHGQYYNLSIDHILTNNSGSEHLKNNFWGIGPLGGINTKWRTFHFGSNFFDLFGDFSMATMWGTWSCGDLYKNTADKTSSVNMNNSKLGALMFRGFMGIEWNINFNAKKSYLATKLGYEMQLWLNQLRLATFQLQRLHNDLTLLGLTFNCRFDF